MTVPLIVLAVLSIAGGLLGLPEFWGAHNWMHHHLLPVIARPDFSLLDHETEWILMFVAMGLAIVAILITWNLYVKKKMLPAESEKSMPVWQRVVYNKYYVDEIYEALITRPLNSLSEVFYRIFDKEFIDGIVNGTGSAVKFIGSSVRMYQSGNIGFYVLNMALGVFLIILLTFIIK
jgi:NADH-quinone oxidoreductase subunit L